MGSNIAGAVMGGLSEYLSLILGLDHLILVAIAFYLFSAVRGPLRVFGLWTGAPTAARDSRVAETPA